MDKSLIISRDTGVPAGPFGADLYLEQGFFSQGECHPGVAVNKDGETAAFIDDHCVFK
ncbi:hypothetical protein SDC9_212233 [bioreactor metagenome]|uniref:Uncharacterized protein n=1 Tax=bioreactor metagenome TaxID=1076179 RepID=A0A645JLI8_9ZZZZ